MKRRHAITSLLLLIFTLSALSVELSSATSRKVLLAEFCAQNRVPGEGFTDTINGSRSEMDEFTSYANLFILNLITPELEEFKRDIVLTQSWLEDKVSEFNAGKDLLPNLYYAFRGNQLANGTTDEDFIDEAIQKVTNFQDQDTTYGFAAGDSIEPNVIDTAFAIKFLNLTDDVSGYHPDDVAAFLISCYDDILGGFKGSPSPTSEVSIVDTFHALDTLNLLGNMDLVTDTMKSDLETFIESNYINESQSKPHYGGYSIASSTQSSLMVTYYSVAVLDLIGSETHFETLTWILDRQNPLDYGFSDYSDLTTGKSSAKLSYYAVSSILILDAEAFSDKNSAVMNEDKWEIESNNWIIAAIWAGSIGLVVICGLLIYKYKNRI